MRTRALGKTGLSVTELGLGTWALSGDGYGPMAEQEQDDIIERALALGIRLFDVADSYGRGATQTRLGERLDEFAKGTTDDEAAARVIVRIGTDRSKNPARKRFDADFLEQSVDESCERLKRSKIDVLLLHNPSEKCVRKGEATDTLKKLVEAGKATTWGVSCGDVAVAKAALDQGAPVLQLAYNPLYTEDLHEISADVQEKQVGIIVRSILGYGLLGGYWSSSRRFAYADHRQKRWSPEQLRERIRQASALRSAFAEGVGTMRSVAVRFALDNSHVGAALLGPRTTMQLDQLVREAGRKPPYLSPEQHTRLSARLSDLGVTQ